MSQNSFEVVFSGKLSEGATLEQVKSNVAALFKVEVAKVERLFSGATVSIKKGLDEASAKKYQLALLRAGAICQVIDRDVAPTAPVAAAAPVAPAAPAEAAVAPPATDSSTLGLQKSVVKAPPAGLGEMSGVSVDAPGITLVEHQEVAAPQIDTSALSMDQVGAELAEHEEVTAPQVDVSGISMGEAGEILVAAEPVEEFEVDISELSMDAPGATLVEHKEVPKPEIDTSKLSLD
jgi:ribosomal protein L23